MFIQYPYVFNEKSYLYEYVKAYENYLENIIHELVDDYYESDSVRYASYILIGDSNKYVVVNEYRDRTQYLYLTQETYNELFPEGENNG